MINFFKSFYNMFKAIFIASLLCIIAASCSYYESIMSKPEVKQDVKKVEEDVKEVVKDVLDEVVSDPLLENNKDAAKDEVIPEKQNVA